MPLDPLHAETMVAALGLDRILNSNPSFTREAQEASITFPKRARALLLRALSRTEPEADDTEAPEFDYDDAKRMLDAGDDEVEKRHLALFEAVPDDIQDDVQAAASTAIQYLQSVLPRQLLKTTARLAVNHPEPFALDRFTRQWRVAVDPMHAMRAMAEGSLDMVMVDALKGAYPAIYKLIADPGGLLDDAIAAMKARRGDRWDVNDDQDRQVKILIGADPIDFDLAADLAASQPITPAAPARGKPAKGAPAAVDELLPGQKQA